jgi:hypothetical protein
MKLRLRSIFFLLAFLAMAAKAQEYPRFRYIIVPVPYDVLDQLPYPSPIPRSGLVHVFFQVETAPGTVHSFSKESIYAADYKEELRLPIRHFRDDEADVIRRLIYDMKIGHSTTEKNLEAHKILLPLIGPVRMMYLIDGLNYDYPQKVLQAIAGVKNDSTEPFLAVRRFGVLRRRVREVFVYEENGLQRFDFGPPDDPFLYDADLHTTIGDSIFPFRPNHHPPPLRATAELQMLDTGNVNDDAFLIQWGIGSEEAHDLSFRAYRAQMARHRNHSIIDENLLAQLRKVAGNLDLTRMFFINIEDFVSEKVFETMAFIDGGSATHDYYETPVDTRFASINLRTLFPGEFIEIHGLAVDPERVELKGILNTDTMAIQLLAFIENGGHDNTTFVLQAHAAAALIYPTYGFAELAESVGKAEKGIVVMYATGKTLREKIRALFPDSKQSPVVELPNRFNRRFAGPRVDMECLAKLKAFNLLKPLGIEH